MVSSLSPLAQTPLPIATGVVKDVGLATFMVDVIEASKQNVILVYFWVLTAAPCKQLSALLEKVVAPYKGAVQLARVDVETNPEIAQQMGLQSVPAIFAFFQGRPVDGVQGMLPEPQIKSWVERVLKATGAPLSDETAGLETALQQAADFLAANDVATAQSIYTDILDMDPANAVAYAGVLRCLLALKEIDRAKQMLAKAPPAIAKDKALDSVRTALELAEQSGKAGTIDELKTKADQNLTDYQARFDLAMAYYAAGEREQAVDQLLDIVRRNRSWNEDAARKQLVKFFEAFGIMDPLTVASRKRLSSIMYS